MRMEEYLVTKDNRQIYGKIAYPSGDGKHPAIILSHGYNGSHSFRESACEFFAANGYVAYAYDFCGGSVNSKSRGETIDMTIGSEKADLLAVFDAISKMENVDAEQIYLLGESQGGFVSSLVAEELGDRVKGLIMFFPALNIPDDWRGRYKTVEEIPEVTELWGMKLGKQFFLEIHDFYTFDYIGKFPNEVLIIQGDSDTVVSMENSRKAAAMYSKAELIVMVGEGHGFRPDADKKALDMVLEFMQKQSYKELTEEYFRKCEKTGKIVRIQYESNTYNAENRVIAKEALVYLPYGYEEETREYNVFYLMHGGGGDSEVMFGGMEAKEKLPHIFDHMIANGEMEPLIVVTPTFYYEGTDEALTSTPDARDLTQNFHQELVKDLLPAIENSFRVKKGREHRGFGGFSMGAEATWNVFAKCLREFKYFLPMSGDCWAIQLKGGLERTVETVDYLVDAVCKSGYGKDDFKIFAGVGDDDIAYEPMNTMLLEMKCRSEFFVFGRNFADSNMIYCMIPGGQHNSTYCDKYMYNGLPLLYRD